MTSAVSVQDKKQYHHGDLRNTLLLAATEMLVDGGIEGLSLRKLADRVGVSRTAPYHHFKDKSALLCGIAQEGFKRWQSRLNAILDCTELNDAEKYRAMVKVYLYYASENPEIYELMFGRTIWKSDNATPDLKSVAYPCFQAHVELVRQWQQKGILNAQEDSLRLAQVSWATMHGLARLLIDGVYADVSHLDEMCDCLVNSFIKHDYQTK
ncbi:TetR/AcrR family transcriptional regulator [Planctobacterium marinum]|uniref:TetR/AcrR family transcriptional regulator n=1 Tax=Planctobacterium marinum TaxID=1631968 RepID=UPI001E44359C|nr:TetR/AcrR family transcriptional regulator [Planctobacterium marinum]MCC2604591.1 TetR/AcrR family transcriptional regulator [Planctobacterium marinum]